MGGAILDVERVAAMLAGSAALVAFDMVVLCFVLCFVMSSTWW